MWTKTMVQSILLALWLKTAENQLRMPSFIIQCSVMMCSKTTNQNWLNQTNCATMWEPKVLWLWTWHHTAVLLLLSHINSHPKSWWNDKGKLWITVYILYMNVCVGWGTSVCVCEYERKRDPDVLTGRDKFRVHPSYIWTSLTDWFIETKKEVQRHFNPKYLQFHDSEMSGTAL